MSINENLRVGIIAEGKSDHAVIANVLKGVLKIERSQIDFLIPELNTDETDLNSKNPNIKSFSNWTIVKQNCVDKEEINDFFDDPLDNEKILIIQIDTAERNEKGYEVFEPQKSKAKKYSEELRTNVIQKINQWLNHSYENIFYAITIEETEAWVLALNDQSKNDTGVYLNVKEKYFNEMSKKANKKTENILKQKDAFNKYEKLSKPLSKPRELTKARSKNHSLNLFCTSLENQLLQKTEME